MALLPGRRRHLFMRRGWTLGGECHVTVWDVWVSNLQQCWSSRSLPTWPADTQDIFASHHIASRHRDTMETLVPVNLDLATMRRVVEREGGCVTWGGTARLSPADDVLIHVERPLDFDSEGQLVASVLSKKVAAGATHAVFDVPVGPTAKVRSREAARRSANDLPKTAPLLVSTFGSWKPMASNRLDAGSDPLSRRGMSSRLFNDDRTSRPTCVTARCILPQLLELGGRARLGDGLRLSTETLRQGAHGENSKLYVKRRVACGPCQVPSTCTRS